MKKLTINFIRNEFKKDGYVLLSDAYKSWDSKLNYLCPKGHKHSISWSNWKHGYRCPFCYNDNRRLDIKSIEQSFAIEGYKLLSKGYINNRQKLAYVCPKGHEHSISWADWHSSGRRCPYCAGQIKPSIKFIRAVFEGEGYTLITNYYENNTQKLDYICPKGHKHYITWHNWNSNGNRCPTCFHMNYSGLNHYRWRGGVTPFYQKIRHFIERINWAQEVFFRDKYICQRCGNNKIECLNAHHIVLLSEIINFYVITVIEEVKRCELIHDINNGITLCKDCHKWVHSNKNVDKEFLMAIL